MQNRHWGRHGAIRKGIHDWQCGQVARAAYARSARGPRGTLNINLQAPLRGTRGIPDKRQNAAFLIQTHNLTNHSMTIEGRNACTNSQSRFPCDDKSYSRTLMVDLHVNWKTDTDICRADAGLRLKMDANIRQVDTGLRLQMNAGFIQVHVASGW